MLDQPSCVARVIAYTSSITPAVTEVAPATSKCRCSCCPRLSRSTAGAAAITASPTGTLMKKTHGQLRYEVRTPPSSTPAAPPLPEAAPQMPSARLRSAPSAKVVIRMDSAAGANSAPPRPCSARKAISEPSDQDTPHSSDAPEKRARPMMNRRRRPKMSASRPPSSSAPPNRIAYALTTHWRFSGAKLRSSLIDGSATLTMAMSRTTMNCAATITASASHLRLPSSSRRYRRFQHLLIS